MFGKSACCCLNVLALRKIGIGYRHKTTLTVKGIKRHPFGQIKRKRTCLHTFYTLHPAYSFRKLLRVGRVHNGHYLVRHFLSCQPCGSFQIRGEQVGDQDTCDSGKCRNSYADSKTDILLHIIEKAFQGKAKMHAVFRIPERKPVFAEMMNSYSFTESLHRGIFLYCQSSRMCDYSHKNKDRQCRQQYRERRDMQTAVMSRKCFSDSVQYRQQRKCAARADNNACKGCHKILRGIGKRDLL